MAHESKKSGEFDFGGANAHLPARVFLFAVLVAQPHRQRKLNGNEQRLGRPGDGEEEGQALEECPGNGATVHDTGVNGQVPEEALGEIEDKA